MRLLNSRDAGALEDPARQTLPAIASANGLQDRPLLARIDQGNERGVRKTLISHGGVEGDLVVSDLLDGRQAFSDRRQRLDFVALDVPLPIRGEPGRRQELPHHAAEP
jgi:hypothetical protein